MPFKSPFVLTVYMIALKSEHKQSKGIFDFCRLLFQLTFLFYHCPFNVIVNLVSLQRCCSILLTYVPHWFCQATVHATIHAGCMFGSAQRGYLENSCVFFFQLQVCQVCHVILPACHLYTLYPPNSKFSAIGLLIALIMAVKKTLFKETINSLVCFSHISFTCPDWNWKQRYNQPHKQP